LKKRTKKLLLFGRALGLKAALRRQLVRVGRVLNEDLRVATDTPARISRETIAAHYLRGAGLEIGALHRPLRMPPGALVRFVDMAPAETLRNRFPEVGHVTSPDIVDDGETLRTIADASQDFVVANHFLEHTEDPFSTLRTFLRVLKPGGFIFMAIPDKRWTFDAPRPVTDLAHLLRDYREGPETSRSGHYDEWLRIIDGFSGDVLEERRAAFIRDRVNIHFHVWTIDEMSEMFAAARRELALPLEIKLCYADPPNLEVVWVLQKEGTL
jgi:SAM-dependent methyltransferase